MIDEKKLQFITRRILRLTPGQLSQLILDIAEQFLISLRKNAQLIQKKYRPAEANVALAQIRQSILKSGLMETNPFQGEVGYKKHEIKTNLIRITALNHPKASEREALLHALNKERAVVQDFSKMKMLEKAEVDIFNAVMAETDVTIEREPREEGDEKPPSKLNRLIYIQLTAGTEAVRAELRRMGVSPRAIPGVMRRIESQAKRQRFMYKDFIADYEKVKENDRLFGYAPARRG